MKKNIIYSISLILFWLMIFNIFRICFYFSATISHPEYLRPFYHALRLDLSAAAYLVFIPLLLSLSFRVFNIQRPGEKILLILNITMLFIVCVIETSGIPLFHEWGTVFNYRAFSYLASPHEAWISMRDYATLQVIFIFIMIFAVACFVLFRIHLKKTADESGKLKATLAGVFILFILIVAARGGFQKIPLNVSESFYSAEEVNNYIAVNKEWYFLYSMKENISKKREHFHYSPAELKYFYRNLYKGNTATNDISLPGTTNVVLIVLESWSAGITEPLGGLKGVTPEFTRLARNGLLFTNIYASGSRTDQGLLSLLSGLPSIKDENIMNNIELSSTLPSIYDILNAKSYHTSFIYGGDSRFFNLRNYFLKHKAGKITDRLSLPGITKISDWGIPDDMLLNAASDEINKSREPFFTCILTLSSHPPFDIPGPFFFGNDNTADKYKSSVHYTDFSLGNFMRRCSKQKWYNNTVFIFVADHGSMYLGNCGFNDSKRFHIPLLIYGRPLEGKYTGEQINAYGCQHDLPATLLALMKIKSDEFPSVKTCFLKVPLQFTFHTGILPMQQDGLLTTRKLLSTLIIKNLSIIKIQFHLYTQINFYL